MAEEVRGEIKVRITADETPTGAPSETPGTGRTPSGTGQARKAERQAEKVVRSAEVNHEWMKKMLPVAGKAGAIVTLIHKSTVLGTLLKTFMDIIMAFVDVTLAPFIVLFEPLFELMSKVLPIYQKFMEKVLGPIMSLGKLFGPIGIIMNILDKGVVGHLKDVWNAIKGVWSMLERFLKPISDVLVQMMNPMEKMGDVVKGVLGTMRGWLPFQSGIGYVPTAKMPAILHRGERVLSAAQNRAQSGGGSHINVMNPVFNVEAHSEMDVREIGNRLYEQFIRRLKEEMR